MPTNLLAAMASQSTDMSDVNDYEGLLLMPDLYANPTGPMMVGLRAWMDWPSVRPGLIPQPFWRELRHHRNGLGRATRTPDMT